MKISRIKLLGFVIVVVLLAATSVIPPARAIGLPDIAFSSADASCLIASYSFHAEIDHPIANHSFNLFGTGAASAGRSSIPVKVLIADATSGNVLGEHYYDVNWDGGDYRGSVQMHSSYIGDVTFSLFLNERFSSYTPSNRLFGPAAASAEVGSTLLDQVTVTYKPCEEPEAPRPGPDMVDLTGAIMGMIASDTPVYYAPNLEALVYPTTALQQGKTVWVLGMDESHEWYKIQLGANALWVPASTVITDGEPLWNNAPLPETIVGH
ncbi:MAG TPA: hypothetical protein PKD09_15930 [Aggregatilinea sp.]|uniref:hypothetical protein n=1 Tax=Aggregatilinea sp. TaxID=2806333 RepID=UPI002C184176|nr:hypothetical protein [Aggregatilinea sp.]HML23143.1 hypothetical protein [Aggregatilinea sp.]